MQARQAVAPYNQKERERVGTWAVQSEERFGFSTRALGSDGVGSGIGKKRLQGWLQEMQAVSTTCRDCRAHPPNELIH